MEIICSDYVTWTNEIVFAVKPIIALMVRKWALFITLLGGLYLVCTGSVESVKIISNLCISEGFRFFELSFDSSNPIPTISFAILQSGCVHTALWNETTHRNFGIPYSAFAESISNTSFNHSKLSLTFQSPIRPDGVVLHSAAAGWRRFRVLGSNDGANWSLVGASDFRSVAGTVRFLDRSASWFSTLAILEFQPRWPALAESLATVTLGLGLIFAAGFAACRRVSLGLSAFAGGLALSSAGCMAAAAGYLSFGRPREVFWDAWAAGLCLIVLRAIRAWEHALFTVVAVVGICAVVGRAASDCLVFDDCDYLSASPPAAAAALALAGLLLRVRTGRAVARCIAANRTRDASLRGARLQGLASSSSGIEADECRRRLKRMRAAAASGAEPRQRCCAGARRRRQLALLEILPGNSSNFWASWSPAHGSGGSKFLEANSESDGLQLVGSLDQLYGQACSTCAP